MSIGETIKKYRKEKRLSQADLANAANLSAVSIRKYEQGERKPKIESLRRLADVLDLDLKYLIDVSLNDSSAQDEHIEGLSKDVYFLTKTECIEIAKRNMVDCIYSSARIEGINVTYIDTQTICSGRCVAGMTVDDTNKIYNLRKAWQFLFDSIDYPLDLLYLRKLNQIVNALLMSDAGQIRNYDVQIGGTSWRPEIPDVDIIKKDLNTILETSCVTERAIKVMLYVMRAQIFSDGNKRVAQLAANQILIQNGKGFLKIPEEKSSQFFSLLIHYYETNDETEITDFLIQTSICGKKIVKEQEDIPINEDMFKCNEKRR